MVAVRIGADERWGGGGGVKWRGGGRTGVEVLVRIRRESWRVRICRDVRRSLNRSGTGVYGNGREERDGEEGS